MTSHLSHADSVSITIVMENWVDMLLPDSEQTEFLPPTSRNGLVEHFDARRTPPVAENGLSLLVRVTSGTHTQSLMFDAGLTGHGLLHNLRALGIAPRDIDYFVLSHGHPDHFGGLFSLLAEAPHSLPVSTHPNAFLPRFANMPDGRVSSHYSRALSLAHVEEAGGAPVLASEPLFLGPGTFTTGEIPRLLGFEQPPTPSAGEPGLFRLDPSGSVLPDPVDDEQALVIDVADEGLIILTGCGHAGVINTIRQALNVAGDRPIRAVIGGFHLGFPTTPSSNIQLTLDGLKELDVRTIVPMHCSGLRTHMAVMEQCRERYLQPAVGTTMSFGKVAE